MIKRRPCLLLRQHLVDPLFFYQKDKQADAGNSVVYGAICLFYDYIGTNYARTADFTYTATNSRFFWAPPKRASRHHFLARALLIPSELALFWTQKRAVRQLCPNMYISTAVHPLQGYSSIWVISDYIVAYYARTVNFTDYATNSCFVSCWDLHFDNSCDSTLRSRGAKAPFFFWK